MRYIAEMGPIREEEITEISLLLRYIYTAVFEISKAESLPVYRSFIQVAPYQDPVDTKRPCNKSIVQYLDEELVRKGNMVEVKAAYGGDGNINKTGGNTKI